MAPATKSMAVTVQNEVDRRVSPRKRTVTDLATGSGGALVNRLATVTRALAGALLAAGCGAEADVTTRGVRLALPDADGCRPPGAVDTVRLEALGDFPFGDEAVTLRTPSSTAARIDALPRGTRLVAVEAQVRASGWVAGGVRRLEDLAALDSPEAGVADRVLLLPFGRSCPLGDPALGAVEGAAITALPDGGLLLAGGGGTGRELRVLGPGEELSRVRAELRLRRYHATATAVGDRVVVAGGSPDPDAGARDTFEVLDLATGEIELAQSSLSVARLAHGALALADGRVLLAGGLDGTGQVLASAEIVDPNGGEVRAVADMNVARANPRLLALDDGTVLVAGGTGRGGGPTRVVEVFRQETGTFVAVDDPDVDLPPLAGGVALALPGSRWAWIGADERAGELRTTVVLVRRRTPLLPGLPSFDAKRLELGDLPALSSVQAATLADGRVMLTGREAGVGPQGFLVDPGTEEVTPVPASRHAELVLRLADGSVAEIDGDGMSLRREDLITELDSPPTLPQLGGLRPGVALDGPGRWEPRRAGFAAAVEDARFDLPTLRFAGFEAELEIGSDGDAPGEAELLLKPPGVPPVAVRTNGVEVGLGLCTTDRAPGAPLRVVREADRVTVEAGLEPRRCTVPGLTGPVGLAVRARAGTVVRALRVKRRAP